MQLSFRWLAVPLYLGLAGLAAAQANAVPEIDIKLHSMNELSSFGRTGAFPDGLNGLVMETTVCNEGTVPLPWFQPMNPRHPKIAFLIASVRDDRIVQISNRSYVKHGFFAANARGCGTCQFPGGTPGEFLGIGCTDTYATANNGDNFYLAPPDEIDPWLGTWSRNCSFFDRGVPEAAPPQNCDGLRSFTRSQAGALGVVHSRVQVHDEDLLLGGKLCFQGHYVVEGLPEPGRDNSLGSRTFVPTWNGSRWTLTITSPLLAGTVLQQWPDATITSTTNGDDDGRVFVAAKVTGPVEGFYRYEYALHNRDNARGIGAFSVPVCPRARVRNLGFRDIDQDPSNDWLAGVRGDVVAFEGRGQPLLWNSIYNFWFECDAAPGDSALVLREFKDGPGLPEISVSNHAPTVLHSIHLGSGCSFGTPPSLYPVGSPALGLLGNASFGLASSGNEPFQPNFLFFGVQEGAPLFQGCTLLLGPGRVELASSVVSDASGVATHALPVPSTLALEGKAFRLQAVGHLGGRGPLFRRYELSDGLIVRLGTAIPDCP